ncbi:hypothetical protein NFJ02_22g48950 [Pycnococcus provasolii]
MAKAAASNESKDEIEKMTVPELNAYLNKCGVTPGKAKKQILKDMALEQFEARSAKKTSRKSAAASPSPTRGRKAASPSPPPRASTRRKSKAAEPASPSTPPPPPKLPTKIPIDEPPTAFEQFRWTIFSVIVAMILAVLSQLFGSFTIKK